MKVLSFNPVKATSSSVAADRINVLHADADETCGGERN